MNESTERNFNKIVESLSQQLYLLALEKPPNLTLSLIKIIRDLIDLLAMIENRRNQ